MWLLDACGCRHDALVSVCGSVRGVGGSSDRARDGSFSVVMASAFGGTGSWTGFQIRSGLC